MNATSDHRARVCVVGAGPSGLIMARSLMRAGAEVVLAGINDASSAASRPGGRYVKTDVSDQTSVRDLLALSAADGPIQVLH
ncbi:MAG: hypothetical protein HOJ61_16910 [Gammaproteobacteria bacterium]|nr:hypothetical protein [Gammaproteobacteria bacterium]MBT6244676.1 hypothetical protein [Gammaproteobacteria bacterium]